MELAQMGKLRSLPVAAALIGVLLAPGTGTAQQPGASAGRELYFTYDPNRSTCLMPEAPGSGEGSSRCYVMECGVAGDHCICPLKLPNGWRQPLTEDQCQQLGQMLRPLPPVTTSDASGQPKERVGRNGAVIPRVPGDCAPEQHRALQD
ncbi:MAG TPA: hypothetical protein VIG99_00190, partial [Myxococcaceae bacterium]